MNNLRDGGDISKIKNLWIRKNGTICKNEVRALINNLEEIPFPDRGIYYKYNFLRTNTVRFFIGSRGCPFLCSFCFNDRVKDMYHNKGNYVRYREAGSLIEEIGFVIKKYNINFIRFEDDVFILNKEWLFAFLERYKESINIPFLCHIKADILNEEIAKRLKEANCYSVLFGVETGNEKIRREVLKKPVSNEQIINAAAILKKYNITFFTTNMLALPGETLADAFETVRLNIRIRADDIWCSIFQPAPNLAITKYALEKKFITENDLKNSEFNTFRDNKLKQKHIKQIFNLHKFFYIAVKFPVLMPLINRLIKLPPNPVFNCLFIICHGFSYRKHCRVNIKRLGREAFHWLHFFLRK